MNFLIVQNTNKFMPDVCKIVILWLLHQVSSCFSTFDSDMTELAFTQIHVFFWNTAQWATLVVGELLDWIISEVFLNLNVSIIFLLTDLPFIITLSSNITIALHLFSIYYSFLQMSRSAFIFLSSLTVALNLCALYFTEAKSFIIFFVIQTCFPVFMTIHFIYSELCLFFITLEYVCI